MIQDNPDNGASEKAMANPRRATHDPSCPDPDQLCGSLNTEDFQRFREELANGGGEW